MSEQIKQIRPLERIAPLIAAVQIDDVRLVESSVKSNVRSADEAGKVRLAIQTSTSVKEYGDDSFFVLAGINAQLAPIESEQNPAITLRATFELKYRLPKDFKVSRRQLNTFARINGVFNAWPYWREFIQNIVARMNLPPIILPVFRYDDAIKPKKTKSP